MTISAFRLRDGFERADGTMQFLVYLTILMVSISTVLLEVHWLTTAPPQPKATVGSAAVPPPAKPEGPNVALSPVYPKKLETRESVGPISTQASRAVSSAASNDTSASSVLEKTEPAPQPHVPITGATASQNPSAETTGVATHEGEVRQSDSATLPSNRTAERKESVAAAPNNRCDIQGCASAYKSFRASDCTYQPFGGARRFCVKPPVQQAARDQRDSQRRRWTTDVEQRAVDRSTVGRQIDDDDEDDQGRFAAPRGAPSLFFFSRPGW